MSLKPPTKRGRPPLRTGQRRRMIAARIKSANVPKLRKIATAEQLSIGALIDHWIETHPAQ